MGSLNFSSPEIAARVQEWTSDKFDAKTRAEIQALVDKGDVKELEDRFWRTLEFGTGGLRGVLGAGTNRMNATIVSWATQGLATYVAQHATRPGPLRAAIAHDCRHCSREFAESAACVLAANGFIVHLAPELRPTPWLSFLIRHLGCHTGIVITASHNPREYNGYKCYWDDGSQVVPPHDKGIIQEVSRVNDMAMVKTMRFDDGIAQGLIKITGPDIDKAYIDAVLKQRIDESAVRDNKVRVVFTPLHGAGGTMGPRALAEWGFTDVICEPEQMKPNGDFPTAASPNPEEGAALERAVELAKAEDADLVLATDPDADRLGIAVKHGNDFPLITGNQLCCLLADYMLRRRKELGKLPAKPAVCSTIVTSPLLGKIVRGHGARYAEVLTGFKWIAQQSRDWAAEDPEISFLYGTEESYGFLIGDHCMDKDGIVASCMTAEMTAWAKGRGMSVVDYLNTLYDEFGPHLEWQKSVTLKGRDGAARIAAIMTALKDGPPKMFNGVEVARRTRVDNGEILDGQIDDVIGRIDLPSSNVVMFDLKDGAKLVARPSGTEPKIKFYFFLSAPPQPNREATNKAMQALLARKEAFERDVLLKMGVE
jgi:phosphoglucomutase